MVKGGENSNEWQTINLKSLAKTFQDEQFSLDPIEMHPTKKIFILPRRALVFILPVFISFVAYDYNFELRFPGLLPEWVLALV